MSSREKDEKKKKHKDHKRNVDNNYNERIRREKKEKFRSSSSYSTDYANKRKRMRTTSSSYDSNLEIRKHKEKKKRRNNSYSSSNSYNSNTDNYSNYKKEKIKNKKDVKDKVASHIKKNNNKTHDESMSSTHSSKDKVKGKKNNKNCYEEYNSISSDKYNKKKKKKESSSSDNSSVYSMKRKKKDKRNGSYEGKNVYIRRSVSSRSVSSDSNKSYSNKSDSNESDSNKSDSNESDSNKSDSNKSSSNKSSSNKSDSNKSYSNKSSSNKSSSNKSSSNTSSSNTSSSNKSYSHISKYDKKKKRKYDPLKEEEKNEETLEINEDLIEYAKQKISNVTIEDVGKAGGVYIPPFKLERLKNEVTNKKSVLYQKQEWMKLKKKINNIVNKVNIDNISEVCYELFECNLIRGKGLFSRALIHAQLSSPAFTNVFTCLLCIVNSKFPNIGLLTIQRIILHFRRAYQRNDKILCFNTVKFIAHMINQRIIHEIVGLQLCSLLLKNITNDSVQVCTYFLAEVGELYTNICRKGLDIIFDRLKDIIQEGQINIKTQYDIEKLWNYRKNNFKDFPSVHDDLNLIDEEEKIIHEIDLLDENFNSQEELNIFREVPYEQYQEEDNEWKNISQELLFGDDSSNEKKKKKKKNKKNKETNGSDSEKLSNYELDEKDDENDNSSEDSEAQKSDTNESNDDENDSDGSNIDDDDNEEIHDMTEQYLINLRKNVYLSIMSSLSYEECVHKLLKLNIKKGYEIEICNMLIDCCCMEKTFQKFYALQAERLCKLKKIYQENFEKCFDNSFNTAHRLETAKLRNCSKFFAHLLYTDAISWSIFKIIKLTEEDTTSSTRIFIKILLQELTNNLGLQTFYHKINHPAISPFLIGLFPTDNAQNIRFCINFFTAIGLGALTSSLRKLLIT
ncbi:cell cycle control protein, putative [Plasmodium sp. gorilla clade G2]|uniref:cell cycle control protein, putative n=1 Tax=Plasmodium sp. gorilla clade G2 TaxID=880535 RepID=UPI000D227108|nr:cell cycle control protein, putative [Plasmodium sp. gorilla clade G2]SOV17031.1 cell cycle control protein, putative [Plasmodium sp. gorilla clade G2]